MFTALLIVLAVVSGAATYAGGRALLSKKRPKELGGRGQLALEQGAPLAERNLSDLLVGDIVEYEAKDFLVEGVVEYEEAGHAWRAGRLVDDGVELWIWIGFVRSATDMVHLMERENETKVFSFPGEVILSGGEEFRFVRRGNATARLRGDLGALGGNQDLADGSSHRCRWWIYETVTDVLVVEEWGGEYRVHRGQQIRNSDLHMLPGS